MPPPGTKFAVSDTSHTHRLINDPINNANKEKEYNIINKYYIQINTTHIA